MSDKTKLLTFIWGAIFLTIVVVAGISLEQQEWRHGECIDRATEAAKVQLAVDRGSITIERCGVLRWSHPSRWVCVYQDGANGGVVELYSFTCEE